MPIPSRADGKLPVPLLVRLQGNIAPAVATAKKMGTRLDPQTQIDLALTLPPRDKAEMDDLAERLFDPSDPLYKHYLTPAEVTERFGPTQADYDTVVAFAKSRGLNVTRTWQNRMLVDVSGTASAIENAFNVHLMQYQDDNGRTIYAPDADPSVPADVAARLQGIVGLDNAAQWQPQVVGGRKFHRVIKTVAPGDPGGGGGGTGTTSPAPVSSTPVTGNGTLPGPRLSGPSGGMSPQNIRTAYNITPIPSTGSGQTVTLVELNGFNPSDIQTYEDTFGLPHIPIQIISVDGASSTVDYSNPNHNSYIEPVLDIEMVAALAPGISKIRVYEGLFGSNPAKGLLDIYNQVGADATNIQTSISFYVPENGLSASMEQSENTAIENGTLTGDSFFAGSGDWGQNDGPTSSNVTVGDPAAQPFVCGVGGTELFTDQYANWVSETTWNQPNPISGTRSYASGGGPSGYWAIPSWQKPLITGASQASTSNRNIPDVSLNAYTNYSIYAGGSWFPEGGTSAAAPLWAAFNALVNSKLFSEGIRSDGMITRYLYPLAQGARYHIDFHDIADGSSNGKNTAVSGYDLTTGLGSFNGANLFTDLVAANGG